MKTSDMVFDAQRIRLYESLMPFNHTGLRHAFDYFNKYYTDTSYLAEILKDFKSDNEEFWNMNMVSAVNNAVIYDGMYLLKKRIPDINKLFCITYTYPDDSYLNDAKVIFFTDKETVLKEVNKAIINKELHPTEKAIIEIIKTNYYKYEV